MERTSLYNLLNMKRDKSIFKSVFITGSKSYEGLPIVDVEPYDQTFINAISTVNKYDDTIDRIMVAVYDYFNRDEVWMRVFTEDFGSIEILISEYSMKQAGLLK